MNNLSLLESQDSEQNSSLLAIVFEDSGEQTSEGVGDAKT